LCRLLAHLVISFVQKLFRADCYSFSDLNHEQ